MRENKYGLLFTGVLTLISLGLSILFYTLDRGWWMNFCFAILGSSVVSFIICLINYKSYAKTLVLDITTSIFNAHTIACVDNFSNTKKYNPEKAIQTIASAFIEIHKAYDLTYYLKTNSVPFSTAVPELDNLEKKLKEKFDELQDAAIYIENHRLTTDSEEAFCAYVETLVDFRAIYLSSLKIAKEYHYNLYTPEEDTDNDSLKEAAVARVQATLSNLSKIE